MGENKRDREKRNRGWAAAVLGLLLLVVGSHAAYAASQTPVLSKRSVTLVVGDTVSLKLKNKPPKVKLVWKTDEKGCVSVSPAGKLRALKKGKAVVSCRWRQGKRTKVRKCKVTIVNPAFRSSSLTVEEGKTVNVGFKYKPDKGSYTWTTENKGIASVSRDGTVKGKKAGGTTIRCVVRTGGKSYTLEASVQVVKKKPKPTKTPEPTPTPKPDPKPTAGGGEANTGGGSGPGGGEPAATKNPGGGGQEPETGKGKTTYVYDSLHRLIKVRYADGSYLEYQYDANGNITRIITHEKK